jgi:hypothetical protein
MALFTKGQVTTGFVVLGGAFLVASGGFSILGAFATSGLLGMLGYGMYETFRDGGVNLNMNSNGHQTGTSYYSSHTPTAPSVVVLPQPAPILYGAGYSNHGSTVTQVGVRPTGSTFVPANNAGGFLGGLFGGSSSTSTRHTGSTFVPASNSGGGSSATTSSVRPTGSIFVPAPSHAGDTTRLVSSTFRPK